MNNKKQKKQKQPNINKGYNQNEEASYLNDDEVFSEKYKENSNAHE